MKAFGKAPLRGTFDGTNSPTITYKERNVPASPGTSTPIGITGVATARKIKAIKVTFEDAGETEPQTNGNGIINGYIDKKSMEKITLELIVQADSDANARTAILPPGIYQEIVLADFIADDQMFLNGAWGYTRGAKLELSDSEDEDAKLTIPLERHFTPAGVLISPATLLATIA